METFPSTIGKKWDKSWFRAHLMTSRIIGEVNLDFLDATFYKQGLQQDETWTIINVHMKEYLKDIVKASNNVSKQGNINKPVVLKKIVDDLRDDYGEDPIVYTNQGQELTELPKLTSNEQKSVQSTIKNIVKEKSLILKNEGEILISYLEKSGSDKNLGAFDYIFDDDEDVARLQVILFRDHPLFEKKPDWELMKIVATSDAIYRLLVETLSYDAYEARAIRNEWLWKRTSKGEDKDE